MPISRLTVLLLSVALTGCQLFDVRPGTYVRVRNATQWTMTDVVVSPNAAEIHLDHLGPGEVSPYVRRDGAYRYGYVRVLTDGGRERKIIPIDYVGESPLSEGHFTFVLGVSRFMPDSLDIGLEQDQ